MNKPAHGNKLSDKILLQTFGFDFEELTRVANQKRELKFLNKYRGALSLWAEYTNDVKERIIILVEGRDAAGKGSTIKKVTEYFNGKRWRINAYGIPEPEERFEHNWFKRYMDDFPRKGQVAFFDRSWYNRAGVEAAMGFCTEEEYNWFMENVLQFEKDQIIDKGIKLIKVYLSITKKIQEERLKEREEIMKNWKSSFVDKVAQEKWNYYTHAKAKILELTDSEISPWMILDSNEKWLSVVEMIKTMINTSTEVSKIVSNKLSIDLKPNKSIRRTAKEELARMKKVGDIKTMKDHFHFRELNEEESVDLKTLKESSFFIPETYSYRKK